ncbi:MAG: hypothetical protein IK079_03925 [Desulfovibrio sp.]|nr:hypothetical protein [Desulfovibrio sp.]
METWETRILGALKAFVKEEYGGVVKHAAENLGIKYETFNSWIRDKNPKSPNLKLLSSIMERIGFPLPNKNQLTGDCGELRKENATLRNEVEN